MHHHQLRQPRDQRDAGEIAQRIVGHVARQQRRRQISARHHQEGVAIGRRLGDVFGADHAIHARPVLDDHLLTEHFGELLRDRARDDVQIAAGSERNDQAHRLDRPRLRAGNARGERVYNGQHGADEFHCANPSFDDRAAGNAGAIGATHADANPPQHAFDFRSALNHDRACHYRSRRRPL